MGKKILIVDDNPNVLKLLNISLSKAGYDIVEAENGEMAFEVANREQPDIIVSDIMMPQMDGIELCWMIRENSKIPLVPFIFLTSFDDSEMEIRGFRAGADDYLNKRKYLPLIAAISNRIETYLDRTIKLDTYTEYSDTIRGRLNYPVRAYPISSVTSVKSDSTGLYSGSESTETNHYINDDSNAVVLDSSVTPALKGLQIIYVGGLASHGTQSQFVLSSEGATPIAEGNYVRGQTSGATGYVITKADTAITIEVLYGYFDSGETIEAMKTEDGGAITNATAVLNSVTLRCLVENYPDIVTACEYEIRYMHDHRFDFENLSSGGRGGTTRKDLTDTYNLLPEVRSMLQPYGNITL